MSESENSEIIKNKDIEFLGLETKMIKALKKAGINTIGDICNITKEELLRKRRLGPKTISMIEEIIHSMGLDFKPIECAAEIELMKNMFGVKIYNILKSEGISNVYELCQHSKSELLNMDWLGGVKVELIIEKLLTLDLYLKPDSNEEEWNDELIENKGIEVMRKILKMTLLRKLDRAGISTIGEICNNTGESLAQKGIKGKEIEEIRAALKLFKLHLADEEDFIDDDLQSAIYKIMISQNQLKHKRQVYQGIVEKLAAFEKKDEVIDR